MFGGPGETYETVAEGIRNLREIEPAYSIAFSGIRVLDGAPLVDVARREGKEVYYRAADTVEAQLFHKMIEQVLEIACPG